MKRVFLVSFTALAACLVFGSAFAQGKIAHLVGYEKADMVSGEIEITEDGAMLMIRDLHSAYGKTLNLFITNGFDQSEGLKVGELMPDAQGDMTFDVPEIDGEERDSVMLMVSGWSVPVGVGLLK